MFLIGDYVKVSGQNIKGYITKISNQNIMIISNDKTITINEKKVEKLEKPVNNKSNNNVNVNIIISSNPSDEIMLRHMTVPQAIEALDKFIDNAICNNIKIIKIIHGKNGGILRREVHKYLLANPNIKEHRLGGYYEGSYGVTLAFLK